MRPKERAKTAQSDLFRLKLVNLIDLRHELCRLGETINWSGWVDEFGALYSEQGRPGVPIRLMVGLHYLKHAFGLSDEIVVKSSQRAWIVARTRAGVGQSLTFPDIESNG